METFSEVIHAFGSAEALARAIGEKGVTVRQWRQRDSIPAHYWTEIQKAARRRNIEGVTIEALARIAADTSKSRKAS